MALAPRLPTPNSDSKLQSSIGKDAYFSEIVSIQKQIPYERALGKFNPYTSRRIEGPNDYAFYCHCYALCRLYETNMQAVSDRAAAQIKSLDIEQQTLKRELAASEAQKAEAMKENKRLRARSKAIFFISTLLIVAVLIFLPRQTKSVSSSSHSSPSSNSSSVTVPASPTPSTEDSSSGPGSRPSGYVSTQYIGNKNSKKFHKSSCSYLPDKSNQIIFDSRSDAIDAGYSPCGRCYP